MAWDFRRSGELVVSVGDSYANQPSTTMLAGPGDGDYGRFQPGAGIALGFDDLKVIECAGLLRMIQVDLDESPDAADGGATMQDAVAAARVMAALRDTAPAAWYAL